MSDQGQQPSDESWGAPRTRSGQPQQPQWGQAPQFGQQPQQPAYVYQQQPNQQPKKSKAKLAGLGCLGVVAGFIVIGVIGAVASGGKSTGAASSSSSTTAAPAATEAATTQDVATTQAAVAAPTTQAAPATTVVLQKTGSGTNKTKTFTISNDNWSIKYSFDCSSLGSSGNFQVYVYDGSGSLVDLPVNALADNGKDTTYETTGPGSYSLEINSECSWKVTVTDGDSGQ